MKNESVKLTVILPQIPDVEVVAIKGMEHLAEHLGIQDEKIGEARILVNEAIINALGHAGEDSQEVRVEFTMTKEKLVIFVEDYGTGFEPDKVEDPNIDEKIHSANKRGWGLKLMKSMSDDFIIESGPNGTKITMIKNLI
ncbi:MAG: ATP-binding protein [Bacteroidetes bacterium]|nr:ATP-binding protein [Bacteroidota bacterium]